MVSEGGCFEMTREGAEKVRDALKAILEQCQETLSCENTCENCPAYECCHGDAGLFEVAIASIRK